MADPCPEAGMVCSDDGFGIGICVLRGTEGSERDYQIDDECRYVGCDACGVLVDDADVSTPTIDADPSVDLRAQLRPLYCTNNTGDPTNTLIDAPCFENPLFGSTIPTFMQGVIIGAVGLENIRTCGACPPGHTCGATVPEDLWETEDDVDAALSPMCPLRPVLADWRFRSLGGALGVVPDFSVLTDAIAGSLQGRIPSRYAGLSADWSPFLTSIRVSLDETATGELLFRPNSVSTLPFATQGYLVVDVRVDGDVELDIDNLPDQTIDGPLHMRMRIQPYTFRDGDENVLTYWRVVDAIVTHDIDSGEAIDVAGCGTSCSEDGVREALSERFGDPTGREREQLEKALHKLSVSVTYSLWTGAWMVGRENAVREIEDPRGNPNDVIETTRIVAGPGRQELIYRIRGVD